jgi:predicted transcriptional regulator
MKPDKDAIAAQIEEGYGQAMRGELLNADEAVRSLHARRAKRKTA